MSARFFPDPWAWRPGKAAWFRLIESQAAAWQPAAGLLDDVDPVRRSLRDAARAQERWLYGPAVAALLAPRGDGSWVRDVQLTALLASHDASLASRRLDLEAAADLYLGSESASVGPGRVTLGELAGLCAEAPAGTLGSLDLCARSVAVEEDDIWRSPQEIGGSRAGSLRSLFAQAQAVLHRLPACRAWLEPVFRVVVPTKSEDALSRSRSYEFFPGAVFADWQSGLQAAVEAVVHETAHHCFHLHTLGGHLVSPAHTGLAWSPLTGRRRPLIRVLLAHHAVAYMSCLHRDWLDSGSADSRAATTALETLGEQAAEYERTIAAERDHLTARGRRFDQATRAVAAYGLRG